MCIAICKLIAICIIYDRSVNVDSQRSPAGAVGIRHSLPTFTDHSDGVDGLDGVDDSDGVDVDDSDGV